MRAEMEGTPTKPGQSVRISDLRNSLARLRSDAYPEDRTYHALELPISGGQESAAIGLDRDGHIHLFLPVPQGSAVLEDQRSEGVKLTRHVLMVGGCARLHADLECVLPHLEETFLHLVDEILESLRVSTKRPDGVAKDALSRWRELMGGPLHDPLSKERLTGLFGELHTLTQLGEAARMLACWTGPAAQRHDFEFTTDALEVKTTLSIVGDELLINGIGQLMPPPRGSLYLRRLRVEESPGGQSVPDLVDLLLEAGADRLGLFKLLANAGYRPSMASSCREFRLQVVNVDVWEVDEHFPRITAASFAGGRPPLGTQLMSYSVDLSLVADRTLNSNRWRELVDEWEASLGT